MTEKKPVHQFNPNILPDSQFVPGSLELLAIGNKTRLLDRRRTPGVIEAISYDEGMFRWRIADFEDKGKYWDLPFEWAAKMQFESGSTSLSPSKINELKSIIQNLDKPLIISVDEVLRAHSLIKIEAAIPEIKSWLKSNSSFIRRGNQLDLTQTSSSPELTDDLIQFMRSGVVKRLPSPATASAIDPR